MLVLDSERERNAAIMLARRFAFDCNVWTWPFVFSLEISSVVLCQDGYQSRVGSSLCSLSFSWKIALFLVSIWLNPFYGRSYLEARIVDSSVQWVGLVFRWLQFSSLKCNVDSFSTIDAIIHILDFHTCQVGCLSKNPCAPCRPEELHILYLWDCESGSTPNAFKRL
jgi:hypothetical protein